MADRPAPQPSVYDLYRRGQELLGAGDYHAAIVPLSRARDLEPGKTSIREALGRAFFHAQRYEHLGRAMQLLGRPREACRPLALACSMAPQREDYRRYRDRARREANRS